jgi:hypothetical protein
MRHRALSFAGVLAGASLLAAQGQRHPGPELSVNNSYRVVSGSKHAGTQRNYPLTGGQPAGYLASPGVPAGTRAWTYTPRLRANGGAQNPNWLTVTGMSQGIHVGAAVTTFPAPNHYQFACGIAPAVPTASPPQMTHAPTGADVLHVAQAPLAITTGGIYEHAFQLTTPVPLGPSTELCLFVVYQGGEWQDDANGGQTTGLDYRGALYTPQALHFHGHATAVQPRAITFTTEKGYRPKIGLQIVEPVFCLTGDHANFYVSPRLVNETYRGLSAAYPDYATVTVGTFFFDVSAGTAYAAGGSAVVLLNVGVDFAGSIPIPPLGNLLLNPADPAFGLLAAVPVGLGAAGEYNGEATPFPVPPLGRGALGTVITGQALVFNPGFAQPLLSTKAGMLIFQ